MATTINTKLQLRTDTQDNWTKKNPILKLGEIAIVCFENDYKDIKIGNGISSFNQLSYLYQNEIKTDRITGKDLTVKSIAQGFNVKATPTSLATGIFSYAEGNFDVVHGIEAKALSTDDYVFVFNGENLPFDGQSFYKSHGEGTFNVNPKGGISGFYIGEQNLSAILSCYFPNSELSNYYTKGQINKLYIDLENKIISVDNKLSSYYKKNETSSASQISTELQKYQLSGDYLLSSDLSFSYVKDDRKIYLKAFNGEIGHVDCDDFIKDGMLSTAYLSGKTLVLVFNTDSGKTPISIDLSSFVDNYDGQISSLSSNLQTLSVTVDSILSDYLTEDDKKDILNQCLSPDEIQMYRGPGTKDITLSVGSGYVISTYTVTLSDFYFKSETSSAQEISTAIFDLSDYIDGFEKAVYGEDKDRNLLEIPYVDPTVITDTSKAIEYLNNVLQINGIDFRIDPTTGTYEDVILATRKLYELAGEDCPSLNNYQDVVDAINHISTEDPPAFASNGKMLFGGSAGTNISIKEFILKLNKKLGQTSSKVTNLSNEVMTRSELLSAYTDQKGMQISSDLTSLINTTKNQLTAQIETKQNKITSNGFLSCSGNGNVVAAEISPRTLPFLPLSGNMTISGGVEISGNSEFKQHVKFNSVDGLSSIEIGDSNLCSIIKDVGGKVYFDTFSGKGKDLLSIIQVTDVEYTKRIEEGSILSNELYVVSSENMTFMNKRGVDVADPIFPSDVATKRYVDDLRVSVSPTNVGEFEKTTLSVWKISESHYIDIIGSGQAVDNCLYIVSSDVENMYGKRVVDVGFPVLSDDAATKGYIDTNYYTKSETSSAIQIENAISGHSGVILRKWKD